MTRPISDIFTVQQIPGAGKGVIATQNISAGTLILHSSTVSAHTLFRQYRKEVCAQCFHYNLGRTLPVRDNSIGKVFCSETCRLIWIEEQGPQGIELWQALQNSTGSNKSKPSRHNEENPEDVRMDIPTVQDIDLAWSKAKDCVGKSQGGRRKSKMQSDHPDHSAFFLDGLLSRARDVENWERRVLDLASDDEPYSSFTELQSYCEAYSQLALIIGTSSTISVEPDICRLLIAAAAQNAFGIRAGSDDAEEYMGYAVYPEASYFNHSCSPNVSKKRVGRRWEFYAARDIGVGEECCITYLGGDEKSLSLVDRRARLQPVWKFACSCQRCRSEENYTSLSLR